MEVSGSIKKIGDTQQVTASFSKRELVVTTEEQYPQHLMIEFVQDKTSLLDSYSPGDKVTVGINLRGREWTSPQNEVKYFNSIQGWRIEKVGAQGGDPSSNGAAPAAPPMAPMDEEDDDLPF
ncbi:DUF3127 domain-containing protein [Owenweeksia hongkongensis]|uniref:DUF3127 domain-containing protein n=1 Tax=Owenweeksia hongkongensis (strain DSM 17368 / CIP 108786 / JCM 12287 / NRRL B-23963 / UST20020801) TaxID=926562 RepID=G8R1B7_OWEHD|nr:DUF3127 domain-containing protein [Owenweeksia hongkongensis]AEV33860.1 Protein of unknown function (DUF3127) [Owenweeksia hongkongensis DSM 17368]